MKNPVRRRISSSENQGPIRIVIFVGSVACVAVGALVRVAPNLQSDPTYQVAGAFFTSIGGVLLGYLINDALKAGRDERELRDRLYGEHVFQHFQAGRTLYLYYVTRTSKNARFWQLVTLKLKRRVGRASWEGSSHILDDEGQEVEYKLEAIDLHDKVVVLADRSDDGREVTAVFTFSHGTFDELYGQSSQHDWGERPLVSSTFLRLKLPFNPSSTKGKRWPKASQRITDPEQVEMLDLHYHAHAHRQLEAYDPAFVKLLKT